MSHHIYTTDAFVLESTGTGEANKFYSLLTRDLGVIRATAQGVRLGKSKLRSNLQDYSLVKISLVRGKELWRITSCVSLNNLFFNYKKDKKILRSFAQVFALVKRLAGTEQKDEFLFEVIAETLEFLEENKDIQTEDVESIELYLVINILNKLGYMPESPELSGFIHTKLDEKLLEKIKSLKKKAVQDINTALRQTQL